MSVNTAKAESFIKDILSMPEDEHKVFTPFALCDEVLDKIPSLDGNILVVANLEFVYTILLRGVDRERVFFATPNDTKARAAEQMQIGGVYKYNNVIMKEDVGDMKFDVVVGNPPYQDSAKAAGRKTATIPLWVQFIERCLPLVAKDGYMTFITPISWLQHTSRAFKIITKYEMVYARLFKKNPFKGVGITPGFWVVRNNEQSDSEHFVLDLDGTSIEVDASNDFIPASTDHFELKLSILMKTINAPNDKFEVYSSTKYHTQSTTLNATRTSKYKFRVMHTYQQTFWTEVEDVLHGRPKVLFTKTGSFNKAHVDIESSVTQNTFALLTKSKKQAQTALTVLHSKLYKFLVDVVRTNSTISAHFWRKLPAVDLTRSWTDEELYAHFNLTEEEIKLIEDTIK